MNMEGLSHRVGSAEALANGDDSFFVSIIDLIVPLKPGQIPDGVYPVVYQDEQVEITITTLFFPEQDPLFCEGKNLSVGTDVTGLPTIPYIAFSDNRGRYPAVLATLFFPKRIASWIKTDIDYEAGK